MQETASLVSLETELDLHLIPELNNLVTGYIYPYLDGNKLLEKVHEDIRNSLDYKTYKEQIEKNKAERIERFKHYKSQIEHGFKHITKRSFLPFGTFSFIIFGKEKFANEFKWYMTDLLRFSSFSNVKIDTAHLNAYFTFKDFSKKIYIPNEICLKNPELFPDRKIEVEAFAQYEKEVLDFKNKILKEVEKYSEILKKYTIEAFDNFSTTFNKNYIWVKIPIVELEKSLFIHEIVKEFGELCNFKIGTTYEENEKIILAIFTNFPQEDYI